MNSETLRRFLLDVARRGVQVAPCLIAADWLLVSRGIDPAAPVRHRCASVEDTTELIDEYGGLVPLIDRLLMDIGASPVSSPQLGDIGAIASGRFMFAGVRTSGAWAVSTYTRALVITKASCVAAWRV
jgi:hypothetical protein